MPYIERDSDGNIKGVYARPQAGYAEDFLPENDNEVILYKNPKRTIEELRIAAYREEGLTPENYIDAMRKAREGDDSELIKLDLKAKKIKQKFNKE